MDELRSDLEIRPLNIFSESLAILFYESDMRVIKIDTNIIDAQKVPLKFTNLK